MMINSSPTLEKKIEKFKITHILKINIYSELYESFLKIDMSTYFYNAEKKFKGFVFPESFYFHINKELYIV